MRNLWPRTLFSKVALRIAKYSGHVQRGFLVETISELARWMQWRLRTDEWGFTLRRKDGELT